MRLEVRRKGGLVGLAALLAVACGSDLFGPEPLSYPHFTATIDGAPFQGFVGAHGCIGTMVTPSMFFLTVIVPASGSSLPFSPELAIHLGGVSGPGRYLMRPNEPQATQRVALWIPGDPFLLQYSTPAASGEVWIEEFDAVAHNIAGRFYFNVFRSRGTTGPERVEIRQGSFRGRLRAFGDTESCR